MGALDRDHHDLFEVYENGRGGGLVSVGQFPFPGRLGRFLRRVHREVERKSIGKKQTGLPPRAPAKRVFRPTLGKGGGESTAGTCGTKSVVDGVEHKSSPGGSISREEAAQSRVLEKAPKDRA